MRLIRPQGLSIRTGATTTTGQSNTRERHPSQHKHGRSNLEDHVKTNQKLESSGNLPHQTGIAEISHANVIAFTVTASATNGID
jgi:hypothetical protein